MIPKPPRFRFSLRTLLIVVTILSTVGGYGVHQLQVTRKREQVLQDTKESTHVWTTLRAERPWFAVAGPDTWVRRALGDKHFEEIWYDPPLLSGKRDRLRATFPEATVTSSRPPFDPRPYTNRDTFAGPHHPPPGVRRKLDD